MKKPFLFIILSSRKPILPSYSLFIKRFYSIFSIYSPSIDNLVCPSCIRSITSEMIKINEVEINTQIVYLFDI